MKSGRKVAAGQANANRDTVTSVPSASAPYARLLLTVEEAGAAIGIGRSLMYELIAAGEIKTVRVGRLRRIRPESLCSYVETLAD